MIIEEIVKTIRADITGGKIRPGEKLPSDRKLQDLFGVSRGTIRETIKMLEGMGLVAIKKGRGGGVFVEPNASRIASESLVSLFKIEESNVLAFIEFRRTIEPNIAFSAAVNKTDDDLTKLREATDLLRTEVRSRELFVTATQMFFEAVAQSTQNDYITASYLQTFQVLAEASKLLYEIPPCFDLSVHFYTEIYETIRDSDPSKARMLSDAYLVQIGSYVKNAKKIGVALGKRNSTIKWGIILDLTGPTLDFGKQCAMGMIDAARYINDKGGINGKKLEPIILDDKYKISEGQKAYKRLRDEDKVLGVYIQSTGTNLSLAPVATRDRMFMFSGGLTAKLSNPQKYPYYFSLGPTYSDMARAAVRYIKDGWTDRSRNPKLTFISQDNIYGRDPLEAVKMYAAEIGVDMGPELFVDFPTLDATPQLLSIQEINPDFAFITSNALNAANLLKDARRLGIKTQFICNNRAFNEDLPKYALLAAKGVLGVQPFELFGSKVPGMEKIVRCHEKWHPYHDATLVYVEGWVNVLVPMKACELADDMGELNADGLKGVLESFREFDTGGLVPPLSYFPHDHRASTLVKFHCIENGRLTLLRDNIDIGREQKYFEI